MGKNCECQFCGSGNHHNCGACFEGDVSPSAILVIAKSSEEKNTAHFLAFTNDEGEAIKMAKAHIWPEIPTHPDEHGGVMVSGGSGRNFDQFTVKRVWACEPMKGKAMYIL